MRSGWPDSTSGREEVVALLRDIDNLMRDARAEFLESGMVVGTVREAVLASWRRSVKSRVRPDDCELLYEDVDDGGSLVAATVPAIDRIRGLVNPHAYVAILADGEARALWAVGPRLATMEVRPGLVCREAAVGTNAIGTTLARRRPTAVHGHEHFARLFTDVACAAAPILDPVTGRIAGIINVTTAKDDAIPLLRPVVERAAWNIEQTLVGAASRAERPIIERFRHLRRWVTGPMAALTPETLLTNAAGADLLGQMDHEELWAWASAAPSSGGASRTMRLGPSETRITSRPLSGEGVTGYLLVMDPIATAMNDPGLDGRDVHAPGPALAQLTDREREISHLVAQGQSNKAIASALWLSRHTVDFHLRQIFQKLAVSSRVELTRVVLKTTPRDLESGVAGGSGGRTTNSRGDSAATERDNPYRSSDVRPNSPRSTGSPPRRSG